MARKRSKSSAAARRSTLLISDVVMPGMDGPTMVREARKSRPELPILFMSGYAEEQLRKSIDIDNVAFLPKPFSVQELAEAARKARRAEISICALRATALYRQAICRAAFHPDRRGRAAHRDDAGGFPRIRSAMRSVATCETVQARSIEAEKGGFDVAILDVNLKGESVWPVADAAAREARCRSSSRRAVTSIRRRPSSPTLQ